MSTSPARPQTTRASAPGASQRLRHGLLGAVFSMGFAIVAAACGPLQQPEPSAGAAAPAAAATAGVPATKTGGASPAAAPGPGRVALLLPLSGAQKPVAEAIRDGFLAAWLADPATAGKPAVDVYDEERPGAVAAYQAAVAAGATTVVGPLLKESVAQVVAQASATVTVLTLNYLDAGAASPASVWQFSLAPEDEARQAAARAAAEGRLRAIALAPDNEWGRRMLSAFTPALEERGGTVLAYRFYDPAATDFTVPIQRLLLLDESRARHRQLSANLGVSLEFEPRRRGDVDLIFLAANVSAGRLIRPQLRFLYAGDIPTYATSAIAPPGGAGDADLDGVMFTDAPALIAADSRAEDLRAALSSRWPAGAVGRLRFYAMGYDAWALATGIRAGTLDAIGGLSGVLSADPARRVHRQMPWAQFRDGRIVPLPEVEAPEATAALAPR